MTMAKALTDFAAHDKFCFSGTGLIPDDVLWRPKEGFSDGLASQKKSWYETLQQHCKEQVSTFHPSIAMFSVLSEYGLAAI